MYIVGNSDWHLQWNHYDLAKPAYSLLDGVGPTAKQGREIGRSKDAPIHRTYAAGRLAIALRVSAEPG